LFISEGFFTMIYRFLPTLIIAISVSAILSTGCGLFTFPVDGTRAMATNMKLIHIDVPLVDGDGNPLEDVTVSVVRHTLDANIIMPGRYDTAKPDGPRKYSRQFTYDSLGNCAVEVTYSKPGFGEVKVIYSTVDHIDYSPGFMAYGPRGLDCVNLDKGPPPAVVLRGHPR
jgi:hypothetical protein